MPKTHHLLSGRLLASNVIWNLVGAGLPLLIAIWAIPVLIEGMGKERFGLLAIVWMGVSYFSLFDLGIGRAITKLVAESLGGNRNEEHASLAATGLKLMFVLGILAALVFAIISPWLVHTVLNVPSDLVEEAVWSFWILSAALPFVISTAGQIGVLQAHQRFARISAIRIPLGVVTFLGPALALNYSSSLIFTTLVLAGARVVAWIAYSFFCRSLVEEQASMGFINKAHIRALLGFGGWIMISNIVGPLMVYFDRFVIGAILTMTAVAYYTTPYEVVTRLWIVPEALTGVLFPALATALVADLNRAKIIFTVAAKILLLVMLPVVSLIVLFAPEALVLWLGQEFAQESVFVLRWLALGVFINSMARLPLINLQSSGRPDLTAKIHVAELLPYMLVLWVLIEAQGIVGAAVAWTLRIVVDTSALYYFSIKQTPEIASVQKKVFVQTIVSLMSLSIMFIPQDLTVKLILGLGVVFIGGSIAIREVLQLAKNGKEYLMIIGQG